MEILFIHLSDIHLKNNSNIIIERKTKFFDSIKNEITSDYEEVFIIISGDIGFSGVELEYKIASIFLDFVIKGIEDYCKIVPKVILVPGNHDCDFNTENKSIRELIVADIAKNGFKSIDKEKINLCCSVQKHYFDFEEKFMDRSKIILNTPLLKTVEYEIKNKVVRFICYNTSWVSKLHEKPGTMTIPISKYSEEDFISGTDLAVSILHHPFNWQNPNNARDVKNYLEKSSDIIITGHEHVQTVSKRINLIDNSEVQYLEGDVFQESNDENSSGFNLISFDLENEKERILNYRWSSKNLIYKVEKVTDWFSYKENRHIKVNKLKLNEEWANFIEDTGVDFSHNKVKAGKQVPVKLSDLYVYPFLRNVSTRNKTRKYREDDTVNAKSIFEIKKEGLKIVITGEENSGKTALCKTIIKKFHENGFIPLFIKGQNLRSTKIEDFKKVLEKAFSFQYDKKLLSIFQQCDKSKLVIIIDDVDDIPLKKRYRHKIIEKINNNYTNVIYTGSDSTTIEELISKFSEVDVFRDYDAYNIIEFGYRLRNELIRKWVLFENEDFVDNENYHRELDRAQNTVDTVIGKNLVPSFPLFILTILQTIEVQKTNIHHNRYGYYYEFLIRRALISQVSSPDDIEFYDRILSEFAFYLFKNNLREVSLDSFDNFYEEYKKTYTGFYSVEKIKNTLYSARIINIQDGIISIQFKFIFYFYIAKYFSENIGDQEVKDFIENICKKVFKEESANILMFVTHLSKDPFILETLLKNAREIFEEFDIIKLDFNETSIINTLISKLPDINFEEKNIDEFRSERLKAKDRKHANSEGTEEMIEDDFISDETEKFEDLGLISKLNLAFKTIEILGHIVRKYAGSLKKPDKYALIEEIYFLGLRSLRIWFTIFNKDNINDLIEIVLSKLDTEDKDKTEIQNQVKQFIFNVSYLTTRTFIKKVSNSVGSEKLRDEFYKLKENHPFNSIKLIDLSIKLDFFSSIPIDEIRKIKPTIEKNFIAYSLLREFVIDRLYMYKTSRSVKQNLCNLLGISMKSQRLIEKVSKQRMQK